MVTQGNGTSDPEKELREKLHHLDLELVQVELGDSLNPSRVSRQFPGVWPCPQVLNSPPAVLGPSPADGCDEGTWTRPGGSR